MKPRPLPSRAELQRLFDYDPETGALRWRVSTTRSVRVGAVAGYAHGGGYVSVGLHGNLYLAHRLIWKLQTGEDPVQVDHRNGARDDNRWANLRHATSSQNNWNSAAKKNPHKGVFFRKQDRRYAASIKKHRQTHNLGLFDTPEAACAAYRKAAVELFGEFAKVGTCGCP